MTERNSKPITLGFGSERVSELLHVLRLPDFDRADRIGEFWGSPKIRTFGELLIDLEEGPGGAGRHVVFGLLAESERQPPGADVLEQMYGRVTGGHAAMRGRPDVAPFHRRMDASADFMRFGPDPRRRMRSGMRRAPSLPRRASS
jgi:hypothetical protein